MMETLAQALNSTGYPFAHFGWASDAIERKRDHGVYAEDGGKNFTGDGHQTERTTIGTVDFFTRDDSETPRNTIEAALNGLECCAWYLNSVQFEEDTGFIHLEWVFEVVG